MQQSFKCFGVLCAFRFGALGLGALAMLHLAGSTAAQQKTETLFNVFPDASSVEPAPKELARLAGAIRQAKVPRECPLGELTIYTPKGDKIFQSALSGARRDAVLAALERLGLDVAGRLFVNEVEGSAGKFDVGYSDARDDKPPTLTTTSQPKKGSKVKARQKITVTMVARDDADRLQTGIESVRLTAESDGGRDVAPTPVRYGPCSDPREKRVVATYVVPDNPPPIVRLRACTWDHTNNQDCDVAEFPTAGDWYGRLTWKARQTSGGGFGDFWGEIDLILNDDGKGNLEGRLTGTQRQFISAPCSSHTVTPGQLSARLTGSYTASAKTMSIFLVDPQSTLAVMGPCSYGGKPYSAGSIHTWPQFNNVLRNLTPRADGGFQASQTHPIEQGTVEYNLILRQAAQQ